ncbi:FtsX-like permease family protein [Amycolatopsis rhizosphaerae]|uniref:FtsX-like permease family protein n=1 Tax=Amycolatopsis rhizosphaerae TaxID=2053003 RepID=A0A558BWA4_9PSEU|nr:ABC transporter permease [Amycolatopsis rhizosphaerae]TVT40789.1 FtsX-like permease family protein [Amycolatopsis rhizosphaerae]
MSALGKVVRAGTGRRRGQTVVMVLTTMMAVTASILAAGLLVASQAPFDTAFAGQRGAHLTARFDAGKVTAAQLEATAMVAGVTAVAGPFPVLSLRPSPGESADGLPPGLRLEPMTFVGRADDGGPVDDLVITAGRWATRPGEAVVSSTDSPFEVGDRMTFPDLPGKPALTVVGQARSMSGSSSAWVTPAQLAALSTADTEPAYQMLYRFRSADTDAELTADRAAVSAAVPPGSMTEAASYLKLKAAAEKTAATFVPFVAAFGVLGLCMSILIIGIVVSGAVTAATRRIGILKSLGFTPAQVARAYVGQALIPASIGTALGVVSGNLLAIPVMSDAGDAFGDGTPTLAPWLDLAVPALALGAVVATALPSALRAGRLRTVEAIAVGRTPRAGRGRTVNRLLGRLPLPRALSLGLAGPFKRPSRSATVVAAVVLGTVGVTFGAGLAVSLSAIRDDLNRRSPGAAVVQLFGPPAPPALGMGGSGQPPRQADPAEIAALIKAQPGTRRFFSTGQTRVGVAGLAGETEVIAYQGDSSWASYRMLSGTWFHGLGEAVAPTGFLRSSGTRVGDTITLTNQGRSVTVRLVGEVFSTHEALLTDIASLDGLHADIQPMSVQFDIDIRPDVSQASYLDSLDRALLPYNITAQPNTAHASTNFVAMESLVALLTLMLVAVAGLGVLNTVVLDTRERVHDFGVFKALGMSPGQTVAMVVTSVAGIGLVSGVVGVPIGILLHDAVVPAMGSAAGTGIPAADIAVYSLPLVVALVLGGLIIATAGALLPAGWAARNRPAVALRSE